MDDRSFAALLVGFVSATPAISMIKGMDLRGKVMNAAFFVCGASALASHLGFTVAVERSLIWHFLLTHLCGISHRTWRTFHTIRTDAEWLSQYTLRYRYVTGSGLRPDTPKVNGLTRPGGLVCSRHPLTDKL